MTDTKHEAGHRYFTADGHEVTFVGDLDGTPYVRFLVQGEYDDAPYPGEPRPYSGELFESPPVLKVDEDIAARRAALDGLRDEILEAQKQLADAERDTLDLQATAEKHEEFRLLLDYLDGKISHVVAGATYSVPKIMTLAEFLKGHDDRETWMRAAGIFAIPGERPKHSRCSRVWKASQYWDGSGSWYEFVPCHSEDEARSTVRGMVEAALAEWRDGNPPKNWLRNVFDEHPWLDVPSDWRDFVIGEKERVLIEARDKAEKELARAEKGLVEIRR